MKWQVALLIGPLVVVATLFVLKQQTAASHEFVAVGGESNQCECTKRLEPQDNWWASLLK